MIVTKLVFLLNYTSFSIFSLCCFSSEVKLDKLNLQFLHSQERTFQI